MTTTVSCHANCDAEGHDVSLHGTTQHNSLKESQQAAREYYQDPESFSGVSLVDDNGPAMADTGDRNRNGLCDSNPETVAQNGESETERILRIQRAIALHLNWNQHRAESQERSRQVIEEDYLNVELFVI